MSRLRLWPTTKRTPAISPVTSRGSAAASSSPSTLPDTAVSGAIASSALEDRRVDDVAGMDDVGHAREQPRDPRVEVAVGVADHADPRPRPRTPRLPSPSTSRSPPRASCGALLPVRAASCNGRCAVSLKPWRFRPWDRWRSAPPSRPERRRRPSPTVRLLSRSTGAR